MITFSQYGNHRENLWKTYLGDFLQVISCLLLAAFITMAGMPQKISAQNDSIPGELENGPKTVALDQALQIALANNVNIKRAMLSVKEADKQVLQAWSRVIPDLNTNMSYTRNLEIPVNFIPARVFNPNAPPDKLVPVQFGTDNNWTGGFSMDQTLFNGQAFVGISSAKLYKAVQSESHHATAQQIVTETRLAYYRTLIAAENVELQRARIRRLEQNLRENRARYEAGMLDQYSVLRLEVQLSNERPKLEEAKHSLNEAYRNLKLLLDIPQKASISIKGDLKQYEIETPDVTDSLNREIKRITRLVPYRRDPSGDFMQNTLSRRSDLRLLQTRIELKQRELLSKESRFLPRLSLSYSVNWNAAEPETPDFFGSAEERARSQAIAVNFSLPIFQGFQRSADLAQARIQKRDLQYQKRYTRQEAIHDIKSTRESLEKVLRTVPAREKALTRAQRAYEIALARLEKGVGSQLEVTDAEVQLRQAELSYARMIFDYLSAKARYDKAIGKVPLVDIQK